MPRIFIAGAIAIFPQNPRRLKLRLQGFFDTLRAHANRLQIRIAAARTGARHALLVATMVTAQAAVF